MTVVMQAAPTATGSLPGASSPFANIAGGTAAPADGSPFAALLSLANAQATGTPATPPIVVPLEPPTTATIENSAPPAEPGTIEVILQDPLDGLDEDQDEAALSAQAALLANQSLVPNRPLETSPLLEAAISEEVNSVTADGAEATVVVSPDALMPALPGIRDEDEALRTNQPSVLTPLSAAPVAGANEAGGPEVALNSTLGDVVGQQLTGPTGANDAADEIGRAMRSAASSTDIPGVVRFDGNASSQTQVAQPATALPLPPAETDPGAARVSILSTFASSPVSATSPVAAQAVTNAVERTSADDTAKSATSEEDSTSTDAASTAMTPPGTQAGSLARMATNRDATGAASVEAGASATTGPAIVAPTDQPEATREPADETAPAVPSEVRPPSATPSNPATPASVAAPIAPGAPAHIDSAPGASTPAAPMPASEPAVPAPSVAQVARTVLEAIESGGGEARIHLQPRELGDVVIHVRTHGDRVEVMVQAERSEAVSVIREHARDLTGLLGQSGLNLADLNVSLGMQQQGRGWGGETAALPNNRLRDDSEFATVLGTDPTVATTNHKRLRATYNPDGAHLYRV